MVVAMIGVSLVVIFQQRQTDFTTTPDQSQADQGNSCTLGFFVPQPGEITCAKTAFADEFDNAAGDYQLRTEQTVFQDGDTVVFSITVTNPNNIAATVTLTDDLSQGNLDQVTFLDSSCGPGAFDEATRRLTCQLTLPANGLAGAGRATATFRVSLPENTEFTQLDNLAVIFDNGPAPLAECPVTITIPDDEVVACADPCATDNQCPQNHSCSEGTCQLDSCLEPGANCSDDGCQQVTPSPSPSTPVCGGSCSSTSQCPDYHVCSEGTCRLTVCVETSASCNSNDCELVSDNPPTSVSCNNACTSNSNCAESNHICFGGRCRLATNPNNSQCLVPNETVVYNQTTEEIIYTLPGSTEEVVIDKRQVVLPEELPESGAGDLVLVVAGAGALVIGGLLLLLVL